MVDIQFGRSDQAIELKKKELINQIDTCISHIEQEIDNHRKGMGSVGTETQLIKILAEVKRMKEILDFKKFVPSYSWIIIDSWDYNSPLALELLALETKYEKVTKKI
jgi:hypothetical protein